jgi:heat shock protein HslJ
MQTRTCPWRHFNGRRYTWVNKISKIVTWSTLGFLIQLLIWVNYTNAQPAANLVGTYWLVLEIDGTPLGVDFMRWQPLLILSLSQGENRIQGFTGCDQLNGLFQQSGDSLRFMQLTTSGKTCSPFLKILEGAFLQALNATASAQISGDILDLKDSSGRVRLHLRAAHPY